ncbi:hypothetical protein [Riemerella columbina]|uniref:hypothetical protein n=1 Tax=Riemerella columbina TaxID=103810 RepID=UPI000370FFA5|nr:hypothetical protein [Riemerella columbina]
MKKKILVRTDFNDVEVRYASWLKTLVDVMQPQNLFLVLGRGTGKTTDYQAERLMDVCYDMPGCYIGIVGDTYTNLLKNVVPSIIEGWNRKGWVEGIHYVVDQPPPQHFKKPYKAPQTYKHTISTFLGNFFNYISMDTPSSGAGNSYQHLVGDETKYLEKRRIDRLFPALRGDSTIFGHSAYYLGLTFTTDYPNIIMPGEYDWILDREKDMDKQQMKYLLQISLELNEAKADAIHYARKRNKRLLQKTQRKIAKISELWERLRKNSTFFYMASSFVNVDILRLDYFKTALAALGTVEFNTSVLSLPPQVEAGQKFYVAFEDKHIYDDGINFKYYQQFNTGDDAELTSLGLQYINPNAKLELGIDFGDQCSMVVAQSNKQLIRVLKNFWTLAPESSEALCSKFLEFFKHHKTKEIDLYYDRSGNQYQQLGRDWATEIKNFLETDKDGNKTGWKVNLMSRNQGNIEQQTEFIMAKAIMNGTYQGLPGLAIDRYQCRELISSMNVATQIVKPNKRGVNQLFKNKTSEKLPLKKRPMYSTNMSDALKYLICRRPFLAIIKKQQMEWSDPETMG